MNFDLVVRPEVDVDLLEAEVWYEGQQAGLARVFLQAVTAAMALARRYLWQISGEGLCRPPARTRSMFV